MIAWIASEVAPLLCSSRNFSVSSEVAQLTPVTPVALFPRAPMIPTAVNVAVAVPTFVDFL
ncbi:MAG TPA: hypothetical protein EYP98_03180 [Planctomycetes bacterium]|nr:hypothetical protein [Planctomycetota bacterium]